MLWKNIMGFWRNCWFWFLICQWPCIKNINLKQSEDIWLQAATFHLLCLGWTLECLLLKISVYMLYYVLNLQCLSSSIFQVLERCIFANEAPCFPHSHLLLGWTRSNVWICYQIFPWIIIGVLLSGKTLAWDTPVVPISKLLWKPPPSLLRDWNIFNSCEP